MFKIVIKFIKKKLLKNIRENKIAEEIKNLIKVNKNKKKKLKILDYGCGSNPLISKNLNTILKKDFKLKFFLYDKLKITYQEKKNFIIIKKLKFNKNYFDYIIINDVIHHMVSFDNNKKLKKELATIFYYGKNIIIKDHFQNNMLDNLTLKIMDRISNLNEVKFPNKYFTVERFSKLIKQMNYKIIKLKKIPIYKFIFPFSKNSIQFICMVRNDK